MHPIVVYVVNRSTFNDEARSVVVQAIQVCMTPQEAITYVETEYGANETLVLNRAYEDNSFEAAWWVTSKVTGETFRLDIGQRDAFISTGDPVAVA